MRIIRNVTAHQMKGIDRRDLVERLQDRVDLRREELHVLPDILRGETEGHLIDLFAPLLEDRPFGDQPLRPMLPARGKTARFRARQSDDAGADIVDVGFPQPQIPPIERHAGTIGAIQTARRQNSLKYKIWWI